jgi:hypothetical protein
MAALAQQNNEVMKQNNEVIKEVYNIINCLLNNNVIGNRDRQLDIWCQIFSRMLKPDGKRMLCSDIEIRFNLKQRAHDAVENYPYHPIKELGQMVCNFLEYFEFYGIHPDDSIEQV